MRHSVPDIKFSKLQTLLSFEVKDTTKTKTVLTPAYQKVLNSGGPKLKNYLGDLVI